MRKSIFFSAAIAAGLMLPAQWVQAQGSGGGAGGGAGGSGGSAASGAGGSGGVGSGATGGAGGANNLGSGSAGGGAAGGAGAINGGGVGGSGFGAGAAGQGGATGTGVGTGNITPGSAGPSGTLGGSGRSNDTLDANRAARSDLRGDINDSRTFDSNAARRSFNDRLNDRSSSFEDSGTGFGNGPRGDVNGRSSRSRGNAATRTRGDINGRGTNASDATNSALQDSQVGDDATLGGTVGNSTARSRAGAANRTTRGFRGTRPNEFRGDINSPRPRNNSILDQSGTSSDSTNRTSSQSMMANGNWLNESLGLDLSARDLSVSNVGPGSLGSRLGFEQGDRIISVNGQRISSSRDLSDFLSINSTGRVRVGVIRDGQPTTVTMNLADLPRSSGQPAMDTGQRRSSRQTSSSDVFTRGF